MIQNERRGSLSEARLIVASEPDITGADLGRRLGLTARQGRNIRRQLAENADHVAEARSLLAASHTAMDDGNSEQAARLATMASAHALVHLAEMTTR